MFKKKFIALGLVVILCTTILLGMSNFVSAATTGNSLPDNIDFGTGYSLPDNWDGPLNATILNGEMKLAAANMISRSYTSVTSGKVIYSFDFDTTDYSSNTTTFTYPVYVHLGNSSSDAARIEIRGDRVNRSGQTIFYNSPIAYLTARGKYSMKIIANLGTKKYDVYVYNSEKTLIGSQLTSPFTADTSSIERIAFKAYSTNLFNPLRVDNINIRLATSPIVKVAYSNNKYDANVTLTTLEYTPKDYTAIMCLYDTQNQQLLSISTNTVALSNYSFDGTIPVSVETVQSLTGKSLKVFLWDGLSQMKPLMTPYVHE